MSRVGMLLVLSFLAVAAAVHGESLQYEVYRLDGEAGRVLLASGTKEYGISDVRVVEHESRDGQSWGKSVLIWSDFSVGASIYREKALDGFGLWIKRSDDGFSWDWFDKEAGGTFKKRQGKGRVRVVLVPSKGYEELASVEFLTDVTLRGRFSWWPFSVADTHHVVIKQGSVLRVSQ